MTSFYFHQSIHHISKADPRHFSEERHFCCLYPKLHCFGHYPELRTKGERRNVDQQVNSLYHRRRNTITSY